MKARRCAVCGDAKRRAIRFGLIRPLRVAGHHTSRSAGGITLCEPCWREVTRGTQRRPAAAAPPQGEAEVRP